MTQTKKRQPTVHVRTRADSFDWLMVGANGAPVARSPRFYASKSSARRGGVNFAARHLKLRKVSVVEVG